MNSEFFTGNIVDILGKRIFNGTICVENGHISDIALDKIVYDSLSDSKLSELSGPFILPGFLDSHIHIESTMLTPVEYSRAIVGHGVLGSFSDPHEIANVCGIDGVSYMIENASKTPFPIWFGASPCVPSTPFEHYGCTVGPDEIERLLAPVESGGFGLRYLSEVMNYPGVIAGDPDMLEKIRIAKKYNRQIDGHAPGLSGDDLVKYVEAGINSDHECTSSCEGVEKANLGMWVMIRGGTAVINYDALKELIDLFPETSLFCTDDCHPCDIEKGTIQNLVRLAINDGFDLFNVLRIACVNPVAYFGIDTKNEHGLLNIGDSADFIVVSDLSSFDVLKSYIKGECVFDISLKKSGKVPVLIQSVETSLINSFNTDFRKVSDIRVPAIYPESGMCDSDTKEISVRVINLVPHEILSEETICALPVKNGEILPDIENDILKIVSVDRYHKSTPEKPGIFTSFFRGSGLKSGAIAMSISHDCHNILATGTSDKSIIDAINLIIENNGGICVVSESGESEILPLPIAGLMCPETADNVAIKEKKLYEALNKIGKAEAFTFMNLSFLSLLVIPELRICPDGLFDSLNFKFTGVVYDDRI